MHAAKEPDKLDLLIETFKLRTHDIPDINDVNFLFGEDKKNGSSCCKGKCFWCC